MLTKTSEEFVLLPNMCKAQGRKIPKFRTGLTALFCLQAALSHQPKWKVDPKQIKGLFSDA